MRIAVGELYDPGRTTWLVRERYSYDQAGHQLVLVWDRLTDDVIEAVRASRIDLAVYIDHPVVILLYRIVGACGWSDVPYSWHLIPAERRQAPPAELHPETRALLQLTLIEAETGIVRVLRVVSLSPDLTWTLHGAIHQQAASQEWSRAAYDAALSSIYGRWSSDDLLDRAAARCRGGD